MDEDSAERTEFGGWFHQRGTTEVKSQAADLASCCGGSTLAGGDCRGYFSSGLRSEGRGRTFGLLFCNPGPEF